MGLVIARSLDESVYIGQHIRITIVKCSAHGCRLKIDAPKDMVILREELIARDRGPVTHKLEDE